jgi:hypothetical protein
MEDIWGGVGCKYLFFFWSLESEATYSESKRRYIVQLTEITRVRMSPPPFQHVRARTTPEKHQSIPAQRFGKKKLKYARVCCP